MKYVCVTKVQNDILIHGDECVISMEELYRALADPECTEIQLTKEFADKFFTYTALCEFVENCGTVAPNAVISVEGTTYTDMSNAVRSLYQYKSHEELSYALGADPTKVVATVQDLCRYYFDTKDEAVVANSKLSTVLMELEQVTSKLEQAQSDYDKLCEAHNETVGKLHSLINRVNFRFEKTVNPDTMFIAKDNQYKHILYIKELTRVHYTDTFLYYFQETLKTLYNVPARTVVIEPYYSYQREALYPGYKPHWKLTYQDVYSGNIFMAGFQPKLMQDILLNSNHVHYLIVLDRGGYMCPHVEGRNVSVVYTASDKSDVGEDIPMSSVISYDEHTLNIPYIENFDELSSEERVQKYSSMPLTKALLDLLEENL